MWAPLRGDQRETAKVGKAAVGHVRHSVGEEDFLGREKSMAKSLKVEESQV